MDTKRNSSLRPSLHPIEVWRSEAGRKQLRLDSIPPNGGSGIDPAKKLELPPTKKDELKAPSKKSRSTIKKEKPKHSPPKVKGAEVWHDCPAEFLKYAREGMVCARVSIPGPGFVLKEAGVSSGLFITEAPEASETNDSAPSSTSLDMLRDKSLGTRQSSSNKGSKSQSTSSKPKGKSK